MNVNEKLIPNSQYRVLEVFATLNRGGAESMLMNIYRKIDKNKLQFDFVANEREVPYEFEKEILDLGGRIFYVPKFNLINYVEYKKRWKELLQNHPEWKVIHAHHTSPATIIFDVANKLNRVTIAHSHIAGTEKSLKFYLKKGLRYPLRYKSDYLFACSRNASEWMFGNGKGKNAYILYNAIESEKFTFNPEIRRLKREELGLNGKTVIGHVGRMENQKNHKFLIEIYEQYQKINPDSILLLIGEGALKIQLQKIVKEKNLEQKVRFLGSRLDISDLLQAMDVFVMPSFYEGLPVTLVEAQASSLPIIASNTITDEVKVTDLISFLSLNESARVWAEKINSKNLISRTNQYGKIVNSGYDVNDTAKQIQKFYIDQYRKFEK